MKQKTLFKLKDYSSEFGGSLFELKKRKGSRPLSTRNAHHFVLRANVSNSGSLLNHRRLIDRTFSTFAEKFGVKIDRYAIVSNHIHLVAQFSSRECYIKFIRAFSGRLALKCKIKWAGRPWSRILAWGRAFQVAIQYVIQNHEEAIGVRLYKPRRSARQLKERRREHKLIRLAKDDLKSTFSPKRNLN